MDPTAAPNIDTKKTPELKLQWFLLMQRGDTVMDERVASLRIFVSAASVRCDVAAAKKRPASAIIAPAEPAEAERVGTQGANDTPPA
jgi:hypothetical protein